MQTLLFILIAAILIVLIIRLLHRRQLKFRLDMAEQSAPLPPLEAEAADRIKINVVDELHADPSRNKPALPWQDEVRQLRDAGQLQEAMALCRRQYPKMLAFRQSLVTLRAGIRSCQDTDADTGSWLKELYRTAAMGDLIKSLQAAPTHESGADIDAMLSQLKALDCAYDQLGYNHLNMLTKTDRKLLVENWGEPKNHRSPSDFLHEQLHDAPITGPEGISH